jgi:hypothetical protein
MNNASMMKTPRDANWVASVTKRRGLLAAGLALAALCACDKTEQKKGENRPVATVASEAPRPTEAAPAPPAPADINVNTLSEDLKCPKTGPKQACRVIKEFAQAKRFTAQTPSGEGRWVGQVFTVEKGVETERAIILWAKRVPTSQVGPGDLPIKVGHEFFPAELESHAGKLVRALMHGDAPSPKNQAFPFAKSLVPSQQRVIVNTNGQSVHVTSEESIFIRANASRVVYLVNPSTARSASTGDGMYAELWLADW